jgi:hypothetical protein
MVCGTCPRGDVEAEKMIKFGFSAEGEREKRERERERERERKVPNYEKKEFLSFR